MKTTHKLLIASLSASLLLMYMVCGQPDPDSITGLAVICAFLVAIYFTFRFNNQVKRQVETGAVPAPTAEAKRKHFWTIAVSLSLGMVSGIIYLLYVLPPQVGLTYTLLTLIPYVGLISYVIYWVWRKHYPRS